MDRIFLNSINPTKASDYKNNIFDYFSKVNTSETFQKAETAESKISPVKIDMNIKPALINSQNISMQFAVLPVSSPIMLPVLDALNKDFSKSKIGQNLTKLLIIHTNDLHGFEKPFSDTLIKPDGSKIGGIEYVAGVISKMRSENPNGTILLDSGDNFDGSLLSKLSGGDIVSKPYKELKYDAIALGNHDFIFGVPQLSQFIAKTGVPFLSANLVDLSSKAELKEVKPYIEKVVQGIKVGILGLTTTSSENTDPDGLIEIKNPIETAKRYLPELRKRNDLIIVLSHLGLSYDRKLATLSKNGELPQIDLIVGGHTHHLLPEGEKVGNTLITQVASRGKYVGKVAMEFDPNTHKLQTYKVNTELVDNLKVKPDPNIGKIVKSIEDKYKNETSEKIGETNIPLKFDAQENLKFATVFMNALKQDADIALSSIWSFRWGLEKGPILAEDLYKAYPFSNELHTIGVRGKRILEQLEYGLSSDDINDLNMVSGLEYKYNPNHIPYNRITSITYKGKEYTPEKFANLNINLNVDDYTLKKDIFKGAKIKKSYGKIYEILKTYLKEQSPINDIKEEKWSNQDTKTENPELLSSKEVGETSEDLPLKEGKASKLAKFFADALKGDNDFSVISIKSLRTELSKGKINQGQICKVIPFQNNLYKVAIDGSQLLSYLENTREDRFLGEEVMASSGLKFSFDYTLPAGKRITSIEINNKKYTPAEIKEMSFKAIMDDFYYDLYFSKGEILEDLGSVFNNVKSYLTQNSPISAVEEPDYAKCENTPQKIEELKTRIWAKEERLMKENPGKIKPYEVAGFNFAEITPYQGCEDILKTQIDMMQQAQKSIKVEMYSLTRPEMIDVLCERAKEGLDVKVVVDSRYHSMPSSLLKRKEILDKMTMSGVKVVEDPGESIFCNHIKNLIIDDASAFIGGLNWSEWSDETQDYGIKFNAGKVSDTIGMSFKNDWQISGGSSYSLNLTEKEGTKGGVPVKICKTNPDERNIYTPMNDILTNIKEAQTSINAELFSLSHKPAISRLIEAAKRGVDVRIILFKNIYETNETERAGVEELRNNGAKVKFFNSDKYKTLHAKMATFDGQEVSVGSANWTFGGLNSNRELNVNVVDKDTTAFFNTKFDSDWLKAEEINNFKFGADVKSFDNVELEDIAKTFEYDISSLQKAQKLMLSAMSCDISVPNAKMHSVLILQKLISSLENKNEFEAALNKLLELIKTEISDISAYFAEGKNDKMKVSSAREALGDYLILKNISRNTNKDFDFLVDQFIERFKKSDDKEQKFDNTRMVRANIINEFGIK